MNQFNLFLLIFVCLSCTERAQQELEFKNLIPETDYLVLEKIVTLYDQMIKEEFQGNTHEFYAQVELDQPIFDDSLKQTYCQILHELENSTLEYKHENVKFDTAYISDLGEIVRIVQPEDKFEHGEPLEEIIERNPRLTIEEELAEVIKNGYWRTISHSSFTTALRKMSHPSDLIEDYITRKESVLYVHPKKMAEGIREKNIDVEHYFIKRIVVLEVFIQQIRNDINC